MSVADQVIKAFTDRCGIVAHAALTDLRKSGLSDETILANVRLFNGKREDLKRELGYSKMNGDEIIQNSQILEFPYFDESGQRVFSRYKPVPQLDPQKKYLHPYQAPAIPFITMRTWDTKEKANAPIWITEGEKKALRLEQEGRHCIALPGIWGFKAGKKSAFEDGSKELWPQIKSFNWAGRTAYLAFDSDLYTNPHVRYALFELAVKLMSLGAIVRFAVWSEGKGIDDYLVGQKESQQAIAKLEGDAQAFEAFIKADYVSEVMRAVAIVELSPIRHEQVIATISKSLKIKISTLNLQVRELRGKKKHGGLAEFCERFRQIRGTTKIIDVETKRVMEAKAFMLEYYDLGQDWKKNSARVAIDPEKIVFKPQGSAEDEINLFDGIDFEAAPGDISCIMDLIRHICDNDEDIVHWLLCWLAYPMQHVGAKMRTTVCFYGCQGSGKNLIFQDLMGEIYGKYASYLTQDRLEDKYNDWMGRKLLVICDEVLANKGKSRHANQLKTSITQATAPVRRMYSEYVEEENHANFVFLSNETLPVLIDPDDRRYMISRQEKKLPEDFYKKCAEQIKVGGGRQAFAKFLLEYDLGDFNEHTKPPMNEAKRELISICEPAPIAFLKAWASGMIDIPYCTCSSADLYLAFRAWHGINGEYGSFGHNRLMAEVGRMADGEKIPGICKGKPRVEIDKRVRQLNGWIVDVSDETRARWFPFLDFDKVEELTQTRKFSEAANALKEAAESAIIRRTYKE